ncbi:MAG: DUF1176 domain-containing protein [Alphaproteobacteria bacterium]|nr:DUF1176 domain-containing protein [Alphaproteobacteria bacterium]MCW5741304.1 DUF1176 domain-containing protein [Alphaproteobacteria bacterium]
MFRALIVACLGMIMAVPAFAQSKAIIPKPVIDAALVKEDCTVTIDQAMEDAQSFDLDTKFKVVLVTCWMAAYNVGGLVFTVDPAQPAQAKLHRFREWNRDKKWWTTNVVWNPDFNEASKRLTTMALHRGIGDCGAGGHYEWSGGEFKLTGFWYKPPCDGKEFKLGDPRWKLTPPP